MIQTVIMLILHTNENRWKLEISQSSKNEQIRIIYSSNQYDFTPEYTDVVLEDDYEFFHQLWQYIIRMERTNCSVEFEVEQNTIVVGTAANFHLSGIKCRMGFADDGWYTL